MTGDRTYLRFTDRHVEPILAGEKEATVRFDFDRHLMVGERVNLVDEADDVFATAEVASVGEMTMLRFVEQEPDGYRSYGSIAEFAADLREYYPDATFWPGARVHLIRFTRVLEADEQEPVRCDGGHDEPQDVGSTEVYEALIGRACPECDHEMTAGALRWNGTTWEHKNQDFPQAGHHAINVDDLQDDWGIRTDGGHEMGLVGACSRCAGLMVEDSRSLFEDRGVVQLECQANDCSHAGRIEYKFGAQNPWENPEVQDGVENVTVSEIAWIDCDRCGGNGWLEDPLCDLRRAMNGREHPCPNCHTSGRTPRVVQTDGAGPGAEPSIEQLAAQERRRLRAVAQQIAMGNLEDLQGAMVVLADESGISTYPFVRQDVDPREMSLWLLGAFLAHMDDSTPEHVHPLDLADHALALNSDYRDDDRVGQSLQHDPDDGGDVDEAGLHGKYEVLEDGNPVDDCFVLEPGDDEAAREALLVYADQTENEALAEDLYDWIHELREPDADQGGDL